MASEQRLLGSTEDNWTKATAGGTGISLVGALFNRSIDMQQVSLAVQDLLNHHHILGAQIVENSKSKLCLQAMASPSASDHVEEKLWPAIDPSIADGGILKLQGDHEDKIGSIALHKFITEELNINFTNPNGKTSPPLKVFWVVVYANPNRNQSVIVLKFHSGAMDRQSGCVLAQDFLLTLSKAVQGKLCNVTQLPGNAKSELPPPVEDLVPKGKASKGFFQMGMDAFGIAFNSKKFSLLPFDPNFALAPKTKFNSNFASISLGKETTASLLATCKKENVTCASALATAFLKTIASLKELKEKKKDEFSYTCVVDSRSQLDPKLGSSILGNYTLAISQGEKVKDGIEFWDQARSISTSIEKDVTKAKQFSEMTVYSLLFSQVMKHPSLTPSSSLRTCLFTLFVDPPMDARWDGTNDLELIGTLGPFSSMHFVGPCFCLVESLMEGPNLTLSSIFPTPLYSQNQITDVLESAAHLLRQSCGGY